MADFDSTQAPQERDRFVCRGTADIDLRAVGLESGTFECVVLQDELGRPSKLIIDLPETPTLVNELNANPVKVRGLHALVHGPDGNSIDVELACFSRWDLQVEAGNQPVSTLSATFLIGTSICRPYPSGRSNRWRYRLTNVRLEFYEIAARVNTEKGYRQFLNGVSFSCGGRKWILFDDFANEWRSKSPPDSTRVWLNARLETEHLEGDSPESLDLIVYEIESLLRLALGRPVTWIVRLRLDNDKVVEEFWRDAWTAPLGSHGFSINCNFLPGQLRTFIETTHPSLVSDLQWWAHTINLYLMAVLATHLEVRMSLQNTLLDRIAAKALLKHERAEIDSDLPKRMDKEFRTKLHSLLSELSPQWTDERTAQICSTIRDWNASPSFPGAVERAAVGLGLWPPRKSYLAKRHKLIHLGEYDTTGGLSLHDYWLQIECLITMMLLRLLGYSGPFYHPALGPNAVGLSELMLGGTKPAPYEVQKVDPEKRIPLVEVAAYIRWQERGCPDRDDWTDWFRAEQSISAQHLQNQLEEKARKDARAGTKI